MKVFRLIVTMLILAMWLPAINHCYLEAAELIPTDECCTPDSADPAKGAAGDVGCKIVEKAGFKTETYQKLYAFVPLLVVAFEPTIEPPVRGGEVITFWPPDTLHLPQYVLNTALPIRAPSRNS